ncbi:MAG: tRNA pseudouridine(38-40) synthase TruA [Flavobacteriales bacterium]|nr:tRNA pseudouridine(38-40) synthase TruA [Flavobacteriales bacterium]
MDLSYDGTNYHGWQNQPEAISVQSCIENALSLLIKAETPIYGAGRTDSGVHALKMYAHFDVTELINTDKLLHDLNSFLPKDISINNIYKVNLDSHARFDALSREYEYKISLIKNVFNNNRCYYIKNNLDIKLMNDACKILLNYTNFKCFSKTKTDVKTYNCDLKYAKWKLNDNELIFTIKANRFLRNMVRAIVGTLIDIGLGKISYQEFENIILKKNRSLASSSAPAQGLFLFDIEYDDKITMII